MVLHHFISLDIYCFHGKLIAIWNFTSFKLQFAWSHVNACNEVTLSRRENFTPKWNLKSVWVHFQVSCKRVISLIFKNLFLCDGRSNEASESVEKVFVANFNSDRNYLPCSIRTFILILTKRHSKSTSYGKKGRELTKKVTKSEMGREFNKLTKIFLVHFSCSSVFPSLVPDEVLIIS